MPNAHVPSDGGDCPAASDQSVGVDTSMPAAAQPSQEPPASAPPGSPRGQAPSDSSDDVPIARMRSRPPTRRTTATASAPTPPSKRSRTPTAATSSRPASKRARGSQGPGARAAAAPLCPCPTDLLCNAHSPRFVSKAASDLWPMYRKHPLLPERNLCELSFATSGFLPVLRDLGLLRISTMYTFYWPTVVREFYTNLSPDCSVPSSSWYHKVYVRGHIVELSPSRLNQVLDWSPPAFDTAFDAADVPNKASLASALTGGSVTSWPSSGSLRASVLTVKYFLLFKVLVNSLCPSSNVVKLSYDIAVLLFLLGAHRPVNLGRFIFDRMLQQAETPSSVASLPYPCLISLLVAAMSCVPSLQDARVQAQVFMYSVKSQAKINDLPAEPSHAAPSSAAPPSAPASAPDPPPASMTAPSTLRSLPELLTDLQAAYATSARLHAAQVENDQKIQDLHSLIFSALSRSVNSSS